eukprot:2692609-Prymnesium_polylepis.1
MTIIEVSLILIYTCVLLIKTCDMQHVRVKVLNEDLSKIGEAVCSSFGFGNTANGAPICMRVHTTLR